MTTVDGHLAEGAVVTVGGLPHRIVRLQRMYGRDGALVQPLHPQPGDGWGAHWVPTRLIMPGKEPTP